MTIIPDVESWAKAAASNLCNVAEKVAVAPAPKVLGEERLRFSVLRETAETSIARLTAKEGIDRDRCLYVITLDDAVDPEALKSAFCDAKKRDDLKLPQDNQLISDVLYVGSSCATKNRKRTLRSRLRQHLIRSDKGTYALSLAEWTSKLSGGIIVKGWQYPYIGEGPEGEVSGRKIVLAVEDWLAAETRPMFGRRGSRN